ncbi:hypothetical protein GLOIN_2v1713610 [Rhizophagus clarus]|uniref:C2H2-type domain-containing protein n=1 Tax=Rhizophagus clarus TaxID=94130 RepID=A0A8H3L1M5_9GLOM|nr:hypothetical protein GLOIN_2v1713610 [Rhizophagus clarus]
MTPSSNDPPRHATSLLLSIHVIDKLGTHLIHHLLGTFDILQTKDGQNNSYFGKEGFPGSSDTSSQESQDGPQIRPSSSPSTNSVSNQMTQNELQRRSSPSSSMKQEPSQKHFGPSLDVIQDQQNELESRSSPSFDMRQESLQRHFRSLFDVNQEPQNEPQSLSGSSFNMNQVQQGSQKRSGPSIITKKTKNNRSVLTSKPQNGSYYSCPQKGCTRTFDTMNDMNRHYNSRHNGRNKRR